MRDTYDYIILGGGAAGLSLAHRMLGQSYFDDKSIAIIEPSHKDKNDRTWSFWERGDGPFEEIVAKQWSRLQFYSKSLDKELDIAPYRYKMIRGLDFYNHVLPVLHASDHIDIIHDRVLDIDERPDQVSITTHAGTTSAPQVFKSYTDLKGLDLSNEMYVDQHFKGYFIRTEEAAFDPDQAVFMDFRIDQAGDTRFLYVLPQSEHEALVEVAIFSNSLLDRKDYDDILTSYIDQYLSIGGYEILEEEFGIIPMTTYPFWKHNTQRICHIGTGGGVVKSSSGYAFQRIQQHSDNLIACLVEGRDLSESYRGLHGRHLLFDKIMLHAILENGVPGETVFSRLFEKKKAAKIFKFLDQKTNLLEELSIFTAPPTWPFTKSLFQV